MVWEYTFTGRPMKGHYLEIIDHDVQVTVIPFLYAISFAITY